ncbi:hypothetical protein SAMN06295885_2621 [Rathayibacter oskolensis]|uniref:Uncharacterized protein n=1 Tax=Rathayibacter oskolensis TaxID=1891671 RepID=A0A1X7P575_9MICO|nr:hypothetical protein [Rathayibacter oskolensis]SMH45827.1 hypothetical protein SAMN06295885_2621 [Rathayibacter oskolensis]
MGLRRSVLLLPPLLALALGGCTTESGAEPTRPVVDVVSGAAVLEATTETVLLPLDGYGPDAGGRQLIQRAADLLIEDCVARKGFEIDLVDVLDYPPSTQYDLNFFGVWTRERALRTGLGIPYDALSEAHLAEDATVPSDAYEAILACPDGDDEDAASLEESPSDSVLERGRTDSWGWASTDPVWEEALTAYRSCMEALGYTFDDSHTPYSPAIADAVDSEAGIRAALDQVDCLSTTGASQTFVDVVAAYQVVFIVENEAALVAEKKESEERVGLARRVIGEHGEG